ncbi:phosphoglycerate kinase [Patescibacteria group bacterium]|nr:phosphoglycerate kinase [Patescibacteria group bacterium]
MELNKYTKEDIEGMRVLLRCDLDVKVNKEGVVDEYHDLRLERIVPVVHELFGYGAKQVIILGHRGRPKGKIDPKLSLAPIKDRLVDLCVSEGLDEPISLIDDINVEPLSYADDSIIMLENLRFWAEEEDLDEKFAQNLARWGDVYVNNAFGNSHRDHSSMTLLPRILGKAFAGAQLQKEVEQLELFIESINPPFVVILGGAKISTKLPLISALSEKADSILLGGGLANTVLAGRGQEVGKSLVEQEMIEFSRDLSDDKIILPEDVVIKDGSAVKVNNIGAQDVVLDIGDIAIKKFVQRVQEAGSILWNGPMGKFEDKKFEKGTFEIAKAIAQNKQAKTLVGGGETIEALEILDLAEDIDFVSTGGGAMLTFLAGDKMPGLDSVKL